jgi:hypothetical protein
MVFAVSSNTGWAESFIMWDLPLSRALQYWHAWLYSQGVWTVAKRPPAAAEYDAVQARIAALDAEGEV